MTTWPCWVGAASGKPARGPSERWAPRLLYDRGRKRKVRPCEVRQLKRALARDAEKTAGDMAGIAWLEPGQWRDYMGKKARGELYDAFSDGELLAILKEAAERLGRNPSKKEVFCVYRVFLIERFGNWPKALVAAGLKRPRRERREANRQRNYDAMRRKEAAAQTPGKSRTSEQQTLKSTLAQEKHSSGMVSMEGGA